MTTYVYRHGQLVEKQYAEPLDIPQVISDTMEPLKHMATGRWHTSKAAFRADTKASGCFEVGNDSSYMDPKPRTFSRKPDDRRALREAIRKAFYEVRNGRGYKYNDKVE
jgi:hypothetical protein